MIRVPRWLVEAPASVIPVEHWEKARRPDLDGLALGIENGFGGAATGVCTVTVRVAATYVVVDVRPLMRTVSRRDKTEKGSAGFARSTELLARRA